MPVEAFRPKPSPDVNPNANGIERANSLLCADDIKAAMRADLKLSPDTNCLFLALPGYTNMLRKWSCIIEVTNENGDVVFGSYLIKPPHHRSEMTLSLRASELKIGPKVIYSNKDENIFVETFYPGERGQHSIAVRGEGLKPNEQIAVGKKLALKTYLMYSDFAEDGWPNLQGGEYRQHLLLVGHGEDIEPVFVDWEQHRHPNTYSSVANDLQLDFQIVATYFNEVTFAYFLAEIRKLAINTRYPPYKSSRNEYDGLNIFEVAYLKARRFLTDDRLFAKTYVPYFRAVDRELEFLAA